MSFRVILISRASALDLIARSLKVPKMSLSSNEAWQINHGNMSDGYDQVSRFHVKFWSILQNTKVLHLYDLYF